MAKHSTILDGPKMAYGPIRLERRRPRVPVAPILLGLLCVVLAAAIVLVLDSRYGWFGLPWV